MSRQRGNPWNWAEAIALLSLDLTAGFVAELNLNPWYSPEVREIARLCIPSFDTGEHFDLWFTKTMQQSSSFLDMVSERFGEAMLADTVAWVQNLFESPPLGDLDEAEMLLSDLAREWDAGSLNVRVPFSGTGQAQLRGLTRDYLAYNADLKDRVARALHDSDSAWDPKMDARYEIPDWSSTEVWVKCYELSNKAFWNRLVVLLDAGEAAGLLQWMRDRARTVYSQYGPWDPPRPLQAIAQAWQQ